MPIQGRIKKKIRERDDVERVSRLGHAKAGGGEDAASGQQTRRRRVAVQPTGKRNACSRRRLSVERRDVIAAFVVDNELRRLLIEALVNTPLVDKLIALEKKLSDERGGFSLFALLMRQSSEGGQDLVIAAPWLKPDSRADFESVVGSVREALSDDEMRQLSAVVILGTDHRLVEHINMAFGAEHQNAILLNIDINDLHIKGGVLITSMRR